jgi:hypothetical protein
MDPAPKHVVTAPSCANSDLCAVINGTGFLGSGAIAETWNGQVWKSWKDTRYQTLRDDPARGLLHRHVLHDRRRCRKAGGLRRHL